MIVIVDKHATRYNRFMSMHPYLDSIPILFSIMNFDRVIENPAI